MFSNSLSLSCLCRFFHFTGQWTQSAIKHRMCSCHHTIHIHHVQRTQHIHTIEWHFQIPANVCPARTSSIQHRVHTKSDVFKLHAVFQKRPFLLEGKQSFSDTYAPYFCIDIRHERCKSIYFVFLPVSLFVGVMYHEHHTAEPKRCHPVVVAVEQHHGL